jgi:hypothetical protein
MKVVLNTAYHSVQVGICGEVMNFQPREEKTLPIHLVESEDFRQCSTLLVIGTYETPSESEINSPVTPEIDDKSVEPVIVEDNVVEVEVPKRKTRKKNQ